MKVCAKSMKYTDLTIDSSDLNLNYYKYKCDKEGYVYILKYPEYVKIGKTKDINKRYSSYDREKCVLCVGIEMYDVIEKLLIDLFNNNFELHHGKEYFKYKDENEFQEMLKLFEKITKPREYFGFNHTSDSYKYNGYYLNLTELTYKLNKSTIDMKYNKPRKIKIDDNELYVRVAAIDIMHKLIYDALNEKDNRKKLKILKHGKYILNNYYKEYDKEQLMQYNAKCIKCVKDSINLDEEANKLKSSINL